MLAPGRAQSAYWLELSTGRAVLWDAGEGAALAIHRLALQLDRLDAVWISHTHPDHLSALVTILTQRHLARVASPLDVHLPSHAVEPIRRLCEIGYLWPEKLSYSIRWHAITTDLHELGDGATLRPFRTAHLAKLADRLADHPGVGLDCFGFDLRLADGRRVVYSADVASADDLRGVPPGIALLIVETTHLSPSDGLALAAELRAEQVVLSHIGPDLDLAELERLAADSPVAAVVAADGLCLTV